MAGLATTAILAHNCEIDMTDSKEAYGLYLYYFRSEECGPIDLSILGINVPANLPLRVPDTSDAVERTYIFALVSVALHGALAITTVLMFGTMCISCMGRGCVALSFYPWILAMFLVLALDVTGFVTYLIDFINVMDTEGVLELLEIENRQPEVFEVLEQLDSFYYIAPALFMWLAFSKVVLFWFMFVLFQMVIISLSMRMWKENKPAPPYNRTEAMQPRQVVHPTSPPQELEDSQHEPTRYMDQAPQLQQQQHHQQQQHQQPQQFQQHQHQFASFQQPPPVQSHPPIYPVIPPPNQLQLHQHHLDQRSMEQQSVRSEPLHNDDGTPYEGNAAGSALQARPTIDPYTDKRFSYLPGQPAPFSYLAGPPPGASPRSSVTVPPPEVRNQLPWSYFPAPDDKKLAGRSRVTSTLTEEKEFPGGDKPLPTVKVTSIADDRSSVTTDEGKWSGPEYKY
uniref:Putative basic-leucine zipper transcription factor q n=1 Tax=Anopheles braziliensis TaxID=58242 RepID=A0A2M3Z023_9DIPT